MKTWNTYAGDPELSELAREEIAELTQRSAELEEKLKVLLLPKDPLDERNIMLEVAARFKSNKEPFFCPCISLANHFIFFHFLCRSGQEQAAMKQHCGLRICCACINDMQRHRNGKLTPSV